MVDSKLRVSSALEFRWREEFNFLPSKNRPENDLVLQLVGRILSADSARVLTAQLGQGTSLQRIFLRNPELSLQFRDKFSQNALLRLYTLESETEMPILAPHLMAWVREQLEDGHLSLALSVYESWSTLPFPQLAGLAQARRDLILNRRGWLETSVYRIGKARHVFGDPVTLAGFAMSGGAYSAA